jgi:hypothetical protein
MTTETKSDYLELLIELDGVNPENYTLDKVYDKEWFRNDLEKIFSFYEYHQSDRTLQKDLDLWISFLYGCVNGKYN